MQNIEIEENYYKILEVPSTSTLEDIKIAYKKKVLQVHPDNNPENSETLTGTAKRFNEVTRAFQILSDASARFDYDKRIALKKELPQTQDVKDTTISPIVVQDDTFSQLLQDFKTLSNQGQLIITQMEQKLKHKDDQDALYPIPQAVSEE